MNERDSTNFGTEELGKETEEEGGIERRRRRMSDRKCISTLTISAALR
jgi:hypothetical protein